MVEEALRTFTVGTGYRWEAMVFLAAWQELESRYGREKARETGKEVLRSAGLQFGRMMARIIGRNDLTSLKEVWETIYSPGNKKNEWTGKRFVVRGNRCLIKETYELLRLPDDLQADLFAVFCEGDRAFVEGFNPEIRFSFEGRIMSGDPQCIWVMEAPEEAH